MAEFKWARKKDNTPEIYSNYVHTSWTLFDVRIQFGQLMPIENQAGFVVEELGGVTITWNQAKVLRNILTELVQSFEDTNGEIKPLKLPPGTKKPDDTPSETK